MRITWVLLVFLFGCAHSRPAQDSSGEKSRPNWIETSDLFALEFTEALAELQPELGSELGLKAYDKKGSLLDLKSEAQEEEFLAKWLLRVDQEIKSAQDPELLVDLQIFKKWLQLKIESNQVSRSVHEVEFSAAVREIFGHLRTLINPQAPTERRSAAIDRFKVYVYGDSQHHPFLEAAQDITRAKMKSWEGQKLLMPFKGEVEQYLRESAEYVSGIKSLLAQSGRQDWNYDWIAFQAQAKAYNSFVREEILPRARLEPRVPQIMYEELLKSRGIEDSPEAMIERGQRAYRELYTEFKTRALRVAKVHHLKKVDPASVIQFLKSHPVQGDQAIEQLYHSVDLRLAELIRQYDLVSLPSTPLRIRMAGEAESRASPVPHLVPPPLVGNHGGERPEFVVPTASGGQLPFDDFSSPDSAIMLTAHEGRPGHDLQFSQMLDHGVSLIRSRYAANSVNIEGWALYAEDLVYPYLKPEEQLFALQMRLWRIARYFLDPQIQLGQIKGERVIELFTKELGVSKAMASLELRRYTFDDIGQAPSYFHGYTMVKHMREEAEKRLGARFNLKCFNDKILSFGLIPLEMMRDKMASDSGCTRR